MIYELKDMQKVNSIFKDCQVTFISSCIQNIMGKVYVTDPDAPQSACASIGCFGFYAGMPDRELLTHKPKGFFIMVPMAEEWSALIEECFPASKRIIRYATKKDTDFDITMLNRNISRLPKGCKLKEIDSKIYDKCLEKSVTRGLVSAFESKEKFMELGLGIVLLKDGNIVSGASSCLRYNRGIEIEVDTVEAERRKHYATIVCSALILRCLEEGLYPSWDAHNMNSLRLAEKLGYKLDHKYVAYEVG